jgi:hypothetical protein
MFSATDWRLATAGEHLGSFRLESFEQVDYPPPPYWDRRAIWPNHIN